MIAASVAVAWVIALAQIGVLVGFLHADAKADAVGRAIAAMHIRTIIAPRQKAHAEDDYPARQAPTDLGRAYDQPGSPWRRPNVPAMGWLTTGYLRARVPLPWPVLAERLRRERIAKQPTGEFNAIVAFGWDTDEREALAGLAWRCDSCRGDGRHQDCRGCGCPCTVVDEATLIGRPPRQLVAP